MMHHYPPPETEIVKMPREGLSVFEGRDPDNWTWHDYSHSAPYVGKYNNPGTAHYFKCRVTGKLKRYGFES